MYKVSETEVAIGLINQVNRTKQSGITLLTSYFGHIVRMERDRALLYGNDIISNDTIIIITDGAIPVYIKGPLADFPVLHTKGKRYPLQSETVYDIATQNILGLALQPQDIIGAAQPELLLMNDQPIGWRSSPPPFQLISGAIKEEIYNQEQKVEFYAKKVLFWPMRNFREFLERQRLELRTSFMTVEQITTIAKAARIIRQVNNLIDQKISRTNAIRVPFNDITITEKPNLQVIFDYEKHPTDRHHKINTTLEHWQDAWTKYLLRTEGKGRLAIYFTGDPSWHSANKLFYLLARTFKIAHTIQNTYHKTYLRDIDDHKHFTNVLSFIFKIMAKHYPNFGDPPHYFGPNPDNYYMQVYRLLSTRLINNKEITNTRQLLKEVYLQTIKRGERPRPGILRTFVATEEDQSSNISLPPQHDIIFPYPLSVLEDKPEAVIYISTGFDITIINKLERWLRETGTPAIVKEANINYPFWVCGRGRDRRRLLIITGWLAYTALLFKHGKYFSSEKELEILTDLLNKNEED